MILREAAGAEDKVKGTGKGKGGDRGTRAVKAGGLAGEWLVRRLPPWRKPAARMRP